MEVKEVRFALRAKEEKAFPRKGETMNRFFVDAETDGLYGDFLSVAVLVTDDCGEETDRFYAAVEAPEVRSAWVRENVLPSLTNAEELVPNEQALLERFWRFWLKHREQAVCIADVACPVEARLFAKCVEAELPQREFLGPFPIYDLATLLAARGIDFDTDRRRLSGLDLRQHDAMDDVRMMAAIWNLLQATEQK